MNTVLSWLRRLRHVLTASADKWAQWCSTPKGEFLAVAITAPTLVVLVVWLGLAHGAPLTWSLVLATILALALVFLSTRKPTPCFTQTETGGILSIARMNRAEVAENFCKEADYEGWYGQMESLTTEELEFLSERVGEYLEDNEDLNHAEFGFAKGLLDKIDEALA